MSTKPTNAQQFVADLGAGTFANQLGAAISMVSQGAVQHNKKGQIKITLDIARIGDSSQVEIAHTLAFVEPTAKGKRAEGTIQTNYSLKTLKQPPSHYNNFTNHP